MSGKRSKVLITGATGFVGSALLRHLDIGSHYTPIAIARRQTMLPPGVENVIIENIDSNTDWQGVLNGAEYVIHTAARVHVMNDKSSDPLNEFRKINVEGTLNLAQQAAELGVKRFIFISSIKVNGESTLPGQSYTADDKPAPVDPYGISKFEAEKALRQLAKEKNIEVTIIRPPLVYGPNVKANFLNMMHWVYKGVPLPLGAIRNKRSLVALDNLVDLITHCIDHPMAANQTFLAADGEDLSTTELLQKMGQHLGKPAKLIPAPSWMLKTMAKLIGKPSISQRLCGSLQLDISKTHELLGWVPPVSTDEGLRATALDFLSK